MQLRTVVVALDGSSASERALPTAALLGHRLNARLQLLAVAADPAQGERLGPQLDRATAQLTDHLGEARVAYDYATADRIVAVAAPRDAVACMATEWPRIGSMARQVLRRSNGPVVFVGPHVDQVGVDGPLLTHVDLDRYHPGFVQTAATWASQLQLAHRIVTTGQRQADTAYTLVDDAIALTGTDAASAVLAFETQHPATLIAAPVEPAALRRWPSHLNRVAAHLIRLSPRPVIAIPTQQ